MKTIVGIFFCTIFLSGCGALFNLSLSEKQREENMRERIYVTNPENRPREIAISLKNFTVSSLEKDFVVNVMDQGGNNLGPVLRGLFNYFSQKTYLTLCFQHILKTVIFLALVRYIW
jgi:hypothetical protein